MKVQKSVQDKVIILFCLLFSCFLTAAFPMSVNAGATAEVTLSVEQVFTKNSSRNVSDVFNYDLVSLDNGNPLPPGASGDTYSFTLTGISTVNIPLTFTKPGIYQYQIKVKPSSFPADYSFVPEAYQITIFAKMKEGELAAHLVIEAGKGDKSGIIRFENTYTAHSSDPSIMADPPVKKTVSGNPVAARTFNFTLTARDPASPMPEGSVGGVKTISIKGSGEKDFGTWVYTSEGTHYYDIAEVIYSNTSYTYDESVYTITDVVEDVDGQLIVTRTVTNQALKPVNSCIFINTFNKVGNDDNDSDQFDAGGGSTAGNSKSSSIIALEDGDIPEGSLEAGGEDIMEGNVALGGNIPKVGDDVNTEKYLAMFCLGIISASGCIIYQMLVYRRR